MFQDADDWSAPDRLELLLEHAGETGAELIGTQEIRVFCDEPEVAQIEWPLDANAPFEERPTAFPLLHPTSLVSRDLVMAMGGFSSGLRFGGDAEFLRRAHHIARCVNVPAFSYYRRVRQGSLTTAPATAIGTPPRKRVMEMTFARAKRNVELVAAGLPPDLSPCETAPPVMLTRLCGPALRGADAPAPTGRPAPRSAKRSAQTDDTAPRPVFVVGADRSGVSALACALGQHPAMAPATGGGVLAALAEQLAKTYANVLADDRSTFGVDPPSAEAFCASFAGAASALVSSADRWVDGSWQNAGHEVALAALFPEARFIHIVRGVDSAVTSLADPPLGSAGATGGTQIPERLRTKLSQADALSRWVDTVSACVNSRDTLGDERMLEVTYAELLADPAALVKRCLAFLGEPERHECMRPLRELRARMKVEPLRPDGPAEQVLLDQAREISRSLNESGPIFLPPETELPAQPIAPTAVGLGPRSAPLPGDGPVDSRRGRIVMVTDHFPKVSETFFVRKFLGLRRRGWDVHVVCNRSNREHWEYFPTLREQMDLSRLHVTKDVEAELTRLEPDIVHFGYGSLARGRMHLRETLGCRMVVSFRGFDINHHGLDDPVAYADVWASADCIHAVSDAIWQRACQRGCPPDRAHTVITDAVDTDWFSPRPRNDHVGVSAERPLRVLGVGRLHWKKGHAYALTAIARLVEQGVPVQYRIAGDGEQREALEYDISDLGLDSHVELTGACDAAAVREHLEWADVFLHPSLSEAFGVAVLEAQAMGVPVVCSDAGGLPENVADGETGFVVPARDPAALADALGRLATEPELLRGMGQAARARVEARFDADRQLAEFERLYRSLLIGSGEARVTPERAPLAPDSTLEAMRRELSDLQRRTEALRKSLWKRDVLDEVRRFVEQELPHDTTVAIVSRGDERLVDVGRANAWHFPQLEDGTYVGHHPADSASAIAHLEHLRAKGARHLVIPGTSLWWLEHYEEFARHLDTHYERLGGSESLVAYALERPPTVAAPELAHASNGKP
jgi:glycosyltransferase involved in cell wall biosynthesis